MRWSRKKYFWAREVFLLCSALNEWKVFLREWSLYITVFGHIRIFDSFFFYIGLYFVLFNCSWTKFIAIIVNVCVFFLQNFRLTILTSRLTSTPLTFCISHDLKFSLNHNFKQLNSIGGILILKFRLKVRRNWCHFLF